MYVCVWIMCACAWSFCSAEWFVPCKTIHYYYWLSLVVVFPFQSVLWPSCGWEGLRDICRHSDGKAWCSLRPDLPQHLPQQAATYLWWVTQLFMNCSVAVTGHCCHEVLAIAVVKYWLLLLWSTDYWCHEVLFGKLLSYLSTAVLQWLVIAVVR